MACLIIQDAFEPYYSRREDAQPKEQARPREPRSLEPERIILPCEVPVPVIPVRRDRRAIAHH